MKDAIAALTPYIEDQLAQGLRLHAIARHLVGAFHGVPGARAFRRHLAGAGCQARRGRRRSARCVGAGARCHSGFGCGLTPA